MLIKFTWEDGFTRTVDLGACKDIRHKMKRPIKIELVGHWDNSTERDIRYVYRMAIPALQVHHDKASVEAVVKRLKELHV